MDRLVAAKIQPFVRPEWAALREELHANGMKISNKDDIPNALILAARRSPIEAVKAVIESYWELEARHEGVPAKGD